MLELTDFTRGRIVGQLEGFKSQLEFSARLNDPLSTVNRLIMQLKRDKKTGVSPGSGGVGKPIFATYCKKYRNKCYGLGGYLVWWKKWPGEM